MNVKDSYNLWKKTYGEVCILQRYIFPLNSIAAKYRIEYSVADSVITTRIMSNSVNIFDKTVKHRLENENFSIFLTNEEKFCVKNKEFGEATQIHEEGLTVQMNTLKTIITLDEPSSQTVSFISADFIKDIEQKWRFISLVDYKFENFLPKVLTKKPKKVNSKSKIVALPSLYKPKTKPRLSKSLCTIELQKEKLTEEIMRDLMESIN